MKSLGSCPLSERDTRVPFSGVCVATGFSESPALEGAEEDPPSRKSLYRRNSGLGLPVRLRKVS